MANSREEGLHVAIVGTTSAPQPIRLKYLPDQALASGALPSPWLCTTRVYRLRYTKKRTNTLLWGELVLYCEAA